MKKAWIAIGESVHASIPKTGKIMRQLSDLGPDAYTSPSEPLHYIRTLIEEQAAEGADYILRVVRLSTAPRRRGRQMTRLWKTLNSRGFITTGTVGSSKWVTSSRKKRTLEHVWKSWKIMLYIARLVFYTIGPLRKPLCLIH
ncbi:hypothetical protein ES703_63525 [subsurface metagenome]